MSRTMSYKGFNLGTHYILAKPRWRRYKNLEGFYGVDENVWRRRARSLQIRRWRKMKRLAISAQQ